MAEDRFAPKSHDGVKRIHEIHRQLIKEQQEANKKARDASNKPKAVPQQHDKPAEDTQQTQPPTSEAPVNPQAEQLQPETQSDGNNA